MDQPTRILVQRAQTMDLEAAGELFQRYRERVRKALRRMVGPELLTGVLDSEDLTQDALMATFRGLGRFEYRGDGSFLAWLLQAARSEVLQRLRARRRLKRDRVTEPLDAVAEPAANAATPSQQAAGAELEAAVLRALERMDPRERQVLVLRRYLDADTAEIQAELDLPTPGAVRALLSRARARLALLLDESP